MPVEARYLPKEDLPFPSQQLERVDLYVAGRRVAHVMITGAGYVKLTEAEKESIGLALVSALDGSDVLTEREYAEERPSWLAPEGETKTIRTRGGGSSTITIPAGATFEPNGEIHVPPRSEDRGDPSRKKFRRACRSARNAVRALAESSGKSVELIMQELRGKTE